MESIVNQSEIRSFLRHSTSFIRRSSLIFYLLREFQINFRVVYRDISATVVFGFVIALAAFYQSGWQWSELLLLSVKITSFFLLFLMIHCYINQYLGIEEDKINKPDRPYPRGLVDGRGMIVRWFASIIGYFLLSIVLDVFIWALLWFILTILNHFTKIPRIWYWKNAFIAFGMTALLYAAWIIGGGEFTLTVHLWIVLLTFLMLPTIMMQDLRDVEGDRLMMRNTFPIIYGLKNTRITLSICFLLSGLLGLFTLLFLERTIILYLVSIMIFGYSILLVWRLWKLQTPKGDHKTYMHYTYYFSVWLLTGFCI